MNSIGSVDESTKLEYSASDIEKCTVEKVDVVAKGESAKDLKIGNNTGMKKYLRCDKCGKYPSTSEPIYRGSQGPRRGLMRKERRSAAKVLIERSKY